MQNLTYLTSRLRPMTKINVPKLEFENVLSESGSIGACPIEEQVEALGLAPMKSKWASPLASH